jgi:ATP-dependent DNA helicase RecG
VLSVSNKNTIELVQYYLMNQGQIIELLRQGENSAVEFKTADIRPDGLAREMIAFANVNGGTILWGIDDDGTISGINDIRNAEEFVMNIVRNNINPPLNIDFASTIINEKLIGIINVPKGKDKPYQTLDGKYYVRIGSTNRTASMAELMRLFQESGFFHFDLTPVQRTSSKSLNLNLVTEYFKHFDIDFEQEDELNRNKLLTNTDILIENGEVSLAAMLVFALNPSRYLPQSGITFVHYKGKELTGDIIDSRHIEGDLVYVINTAFACIKNNMLNPSIIVGLERQETKTNYSDKVYREIITNACAHRDYSIQGSRIRILMFDDRIEFISPGKLPNTITIEKLASGVSFRRNQLLAKFMVALRLMDTFGRGIPNILAEAKKLNKQVIFEEIGDEMKVTLPIDS